MLATTGSTLAWLSASGLEGAGAQGQPMLKNMGGEGPGFGNRSRAGGFDILEHCHSSASAWSGSTSRRVGPMPCVR